MRRLNAVAFLTQPLAHLFRNHHGAVLPSGAPKRDGEITLPFRNIVGQKEEQHVSSSLQKLGGLRELPDVGCDLWVLACKAAEFRDEMRIRQKTHVEDKIRFERHAVLESKADARDQQILFRVSSLELILN